MQEPLRLLVCGDRHWTDKAMIRDALARRLEYEESGIIIIEGEASGADRLAAEVARELGLEVLPFPADWQRWGRAAGPIRNRQMLIEGRPDVVWAFHDNLATSRGTRDMLLQARELAIATRVFKHGQSGR